MVLAGIAAQQHRPRGLDDVVEISSYIRVDFFFGFVGFFGGQYRNVAQSARIEGDTSDVDWPAGWLLLVCGGVVIVGFRFLCGAAAKHWESTRGGAGFWGVGGGQGNSLRADRDRVGAVGRSHRAVRDGICHVGEM